MSALGDKLRCPHCLEELDHLEDPKQLPCSHVYCSPCLESLTKTEEETVEITCSICSTCHKVESLVELPTPQDGTSVQDTNETRNSANSDGQEGKVKPERRCDVCKEETTAVCYCVECDKSLCPRHEQIHQEFFGESDQDHKLISIQTYMLKTNFYMKPKCDQHNKEYALSCERCFCLRCKDCAEDSKCKEDNKHFYITMHDIRSQLEAEFADLTKAVSDKMTEMCRLEKETWQNLDNLELECDRLRCEVKEKTNRMIRAISDQQDKFLARIEAFVIYKKSQVEIQLLELRTQREDMETLRCESELLVRNSHVTKIIEQREDTVSRLKEVADATLKKWDQMDLFMLEESLKSYLLKSPAMIPDTVEFISSHETGGSCYSTWFRQDGQLLVGCHDGLREYSLYGRGHKNLRRIWHVTSIARWHVDNLCLIVFNDTWKGDTKVKVTSSNSSTQQTISVNDETACLFSYSNPDTSRIAKFLSASEKYVAATTASMNSMQLYDDEKKTYVTTKLSHSIFQLHFYSDDHLLITGNHTLYMYCIANINCPNLVWTRSGLQGARGVCTTASGLIVCASKTEKVIHILTAQGKLLKTLHNEKIQPSWGQISTHGDILAVACPEKDMFQLFRLK